MGLSVTATYGIIFTASLLLFGVLLNSLLYAYDNFQRGMNNKIELIQNSKNQIKIERITYSDSKISVFAFNSGPLTLQTSRMSILINGTLQNFTAPETWYPGVNITITLNSSYYLGTQHMRQFQLLPGNDVVASTEEDKIYIVNSTELFAYSYAGTLLWERSVNGPRDVSSSSSVFVLNGTGITVFSKNGQKTGFYSVTNLTSLDSRGPYIYGVNSTNFVVINATTGNIVKSASLSQGRDVAVGKYVYVLDGNVVKIYDYEGNYVSSITDSRLQDAIKITSDWESYGNYLVVLTSYGSLLIYSNNTYVESITLSEDASNVDLYGKIYLSSSALVALDGGYRVKIVDEYGNEVYDFL